MPALSWKRNLFFMWIAQFFSIMGFSFGLPFAPFYIQSMGITEPSQIKMWTAVFAAAPALTFMIFAPFWGSASDKFGRKIMLIRSYVGGAVVLTLMGLVGNVWQLIGLRLLQGMLTGSVTAAQTMVSVNTPIERSGFAIGSLSAMIYIGNMAGNSLGGYFADAFGYRMAFIVSGSMLFLPVLLVGFFVKENFTTVVGASIWPSIKTISGNISKLSAALPILAIIFVSGFCVFFDSGMFPLLVQEIHGKLEGASLRTGSINAVAGFGAIAGSMIVSSLTDKIAPSKIAVVAAVIAGLAMLPQAFASTLATLVIFRFFMAMCSTSLDPIFQVWLSKVTPPNIRGMVFGMASTSRSFGWFTAPLLSGLLATAYGIRFIYFAGIFNYLILSLTIILVIKKFGTVKKPIRPAV
ncbi:MAG: hypothetical protein A2020_00600 [Lentisphaerae bacterium GWF2_45_14]|nr:MAG: hypothetical protein A2020_00600 [Lentisphaerae bacterium GWF2_45_14]